MANRSTRPSLTLRSCGRGDGGTTCCTGLAGPASPCMSSLRGGPADAALGGCGGVPQGARTAKAVRRLFTTRTRSSRRQARANPCRCPGRKVPGAGRTWFGAQVVVCDRRDEPGSAHSGTGIGAICAGGRSLRVVRPCGARAAVQSKVDSKAHVCLPGYCFTTSQPGLCFTTSQPGLCFTTSQPGPVASTTPTTSLSRSACRASRSSQPNPADVRPTTARGTSCQVKTRHVTHGDPAEAKPPGQSQPSRVHPVKQRAGAMRTRTGAQSSSRLRASSVARIFA